MIWSGGKTREIVCSCRSFEGLKGENNAQLNSECDAWQSLQFPSGNQDADDLFLFNDDDDDGDYD